MKSINKVTLLGFIGSIKDAGKGKSVSIATTRYWKKDGDADWQSKTEWHNVFLNEKLVPKDLEIGSPVYAEGSLQYTEKDGKYFTNIYADIFTITERSQKEAGSGNYPPKANKSSNSKADTPPEYDEPFGQEEDEEDPFAN